MAVSPMMPTGLRPPGSFTKNFGWSGRGFLRLHEAVRAGFSGGLTPVERNEWRSVAKLTDTKFLLATNFFLHNSIQGERNFIAVDEFVRQAVMEPHSQAFDRLTLFVLNLSLGGKRLGSGHGVEFPAPWANKFVRDELWKAGRWRRDALDESRMDVFMSKHIAGVDAARIKCRSNYRHMFELVHYIPTSNPEINADAESWIAGALFTAWDRRSIANRSTASSLSANALIVASESAEDFKLLGISVDEFRGIAQPIAEEYAAVGGSHRFAAFGSPSFAGSLRPAVSIASQTFASASPSAGGEPKKPSPAAPALSASLPAEDLGWLTVAGSDAAVERGIAKRLEQKRDRVLAVKLKELYKHKCMACGSALVIGLDPQRCHAEAAHIKPLGLPHSGPDKAGNMLVLCPGHHIQFDRGILSLVSGPKGITLLSRIKGDPLHRKVIELHADHKLDTDCVAWHATMFSNVGK